MSCGENCTCTPAVPVVGEVVKETGYRVTGSRTKYVNERFATKEEAIAFAATLLEDGFESAHVTDLSRDGDYW